jgi:HEAT repeat protein
MKDILAKLKGGDRRSIGKSEQAVKDVLKNPARFAELFAGLLDDDRLVRMRAADAVEKVTREHPEFLQPWKRQLLGTVSTQEDKELRWHVAQMLPRLRLTPSEQKVVLRILKIYLEDESSIVKTCSMQALADLAAQDERLLAEVTPLIERLTRTGTPAMMSRGRKLLKRLGVTE